MPPKENYKYNNHNNRYLKNVSGLKPMTLIFGAKCNDGVVLVGDRKVRYGQEPYTDKIRICGNFNWVIFGAAGDGFLFEEFLTMLPQKIDTHNDWLQYQNQRLMHQHTQEFGNTPNIREPPQMIYSIEDFKQDCVGLLTEMRNRYSIAFSSNPYCRLDVLFGFTVQNGDSKLCYIDTTNCRPAEVNGCIAIGQNELVEIFRKSWEQTMNMSQTAKLAMLTIKYIEREQISEDIGVGSQQPQVWFIPNNQMPKEIVGDELLTMVNDVDIQVNALHNQIYSLFRS